MKILIVEDDFRIADMYKEFLLEHSKASEIFTVNNASQCLELLEIERDIELILLDIYLPDILGDELMETIIRRYPYIDFIVITATQNGDIFKRMMHLGAKYYLVKPIQLKKLSKTVDDYIDKKKFIRNTSEINQETIDEYFGHARPASEENMLPKGIDSITLNVIEEAFKRDGEWTATKLGHHLGTSRTTVRRYLEYMRETGKLKVLLEYGDKGRPEKKYILK
ncbi:MAG TPA: response regulator [Candidatus Dormibacteraeota bacterium]|nr:response regulator [Candidatus Dormibacteraeota bacterium]